MSEPIRGLMLPGALSDPGDILVTIDRAADVGCNCFRIFGDYYDGNGKGFGPWDEFRWLVSPFKMIDVWNPGACVGQQTPNVPMRDLDQKNPPYWEKLEAILTKMYERKATLWFVAQDFCSTFLTGWQRWLNSFYGNVQRYPFYKTPGAYANGVEPAIGGERIGYGLDHYYWQYAKWVVDLAYKVGHRAIWLEPWNEVGTGNATTDDLYSWFDRQRALYKNLEGAPKKNIAITVAGSCRPPLLNTLLQGHCDVVDAHCIIEKADFAVHAQGLLPGFTILDSDGAENGKGTSESCLHYKNMSVTQAREIGLAVSEDKWLGFVYMPQEQYVIENGPFISGHIDMSVLEEADRSSGWTSLLPPPPPPVEKVTVTVCLQNSKYLANFNCPNPIVFEFDKGTEPTALCPFHNPPVQHSKWTLFWRKVKKILTSLGGRR